MNPNDNLNHLSISSPSPTEKLIIDAPGNFSLADPNPGAVLRIGDSKSPTEVARIFPIYQSLSDEKKLSFLCNMSAWCASEIAGLTPPLRIGDAKLTGVHGIGIGTTNSEHDLLHVKCPECGSVLVMRGVGWTVDYGFGIKLSCVCGRVFAVDSKVPTIEDGGNVGIDT